MALLALVALVLGFPFLAFSAGGSGTQSATAEAVRRPAAKPRLAVRTPRPLVVEGSRFIPGERVRVAAPGSTTRVRAGRFGRFVVRLAAVDACNGGTVVAVGSSGSRAQVALGQLSNIHCL